MKFKTAGIAMTKPLLAMPTSKKWVFDGLIRQVGISTLVMVHGKEKIGKTWLVYDMALSLASGFPFMEKFVPSSDIKTIAILSPEGGVDLAKERLWGLVDGHKIDRKSIIDKVLLADLDYMSIDLSTNKGLEELKNAISEYNIDALVIDPIIEFYSIDENDNSSMAQFFTRLRLLSADRPLVIIFTHHNRKNDGEARGASSILGKYDFCISLEKKGGSTVGIKFNSRNSRTPPPVMMRYEFIDNGLYDRVKIDYIHNNRDSLLTKLVALLNNGEYSNVDVIAKDLCVRRADVAKILKTSKFKKINNLYKPVIGTDD